MIILASAAFGFAVGATAVLAYLRYLARHEANPWATALGLLALGGGVGGVVGAVAALLIAFAVVRAMGW
jgi:hypothetical protein